MHINFFCNHKCGSVWLFRYLRKFSEINDYDFFSSNRGSKGFRKDEIRRNSVVMYRNAQYASIKNVCERGVRIIRDPRAIVNSAYFSHLSTHNVDDWQQLRRQRTLLESLDIESGMRMTLAFLEKQNFYHDTVGPLNALQSWFYDDQRYLSIRMEDFVNDPDKYMRRSIIANGGDPDQFKLPKAEEFSFERITGRENGIVDNKSHFRSGNPRDWENNLPEDVVKYLNTHFYRLIGDFYD